MDDQQYPMHAAARKGDVNAVLTLLNQGIDVDSRDARSLTPLFYAAMEGHEGVAKILVERGADINARDSDILSKAEVPTLLTVAIATGSVELVRLLISHGADVDGDIGGFCPWSAAFECKHFEIAKLLAESGASANAWCLYHGHMWWSPLMMAAINGQTELTRMLLARGADVDFRDEYGESALNKAKLGGDDELIELIERATKLKERDCVISGDVHRLMSFLAHDDVDPADADGLTVLHVLADAGRPALMRLALRSGADPNAIDRNGMTPLHRAAQYACEGLSECLSDDDEDYVSDVVMRMALELLKGGANVNARDNQGNTPLHDALSVGWAADGCTFDACLSLALELLEHGATPGLRNNTGQCPMNSLLFDLPGPVMGQANTSAVEGLPDRLVQVIEKAVSKGGDINCQDDKAKTVLHVAASLNWHNLIRRCLRLGADPNITDGNGLYPYHIAYRKCDDINVERLLMTRDAVRAVDDSGRTLLHIAVLEKDGLNEDHLFEYDDELALVRDNDGKTPLHLAAECGNASVIRMFVEAEGTEWEPLGAVVLCIQDNKGNTALHLANSVEVAARLVAVGADMNARNMHGQTPLDAALARGCQPVADFLSGPGAS